MQPVPLEQHSNLAWHEKPYTVLLDTSKRDRENQRSLLFTDPVEVLQIFRPAELPELLDTMECRVQNGYYAAGYLHYECGQAFESVTDRPATARAAADTPVAWFGIYDQPQEVSPASLLDKAAGDEGAAIHDPQFSLSRSSYKEKFRRIKHHIREGDVYQVNLTGHLSFTCSGTPAALYRRLRANQAVPYGAYIRTADQTVLCLSPELFFRRQGDHIITRPMKGTIRRGRTLDEDRQLRRRLADDEKSRAENLMIVDLLRNDFSRVANLDSVRVSSMFDTETYDTVTQMTSTIEASLRDGITYRNLFQALFPCGSVTGAPKIRAMRIIDGLEEGRRGIYCGSIGFISPDREAAFNVAIRTVVLDGTQGRMGTGSGIVWDSDADLEYDECVLKADFLTRSTPAFHLIETIRWKERYQLLERHLNRLERSARYFQFPFSRSAVQQQLESYGKQLGSRRVYKVRLCMHRTGRVEITHGAVEPSDNESWTIRMAEMRIDPADRYRYHKTSRRGKLDRLHREAAADGYDEIVFLNIRGEVTEGSRSNIFVRQGEQYFTPPVSCGLLPGVYRAYLLDTLAGAQEKVLHPDDLYSAEEIYLCNAIRGMQKARLVDSSKRLNV